MRKAILIGSLFALCASLVLPMLRPVRTKRIQYGTLLKRDDTFVGSSAWWTGAPQQTLLSRLAAERGWETTAGAWSSLGCNAEGLTLYVTADSERVAKFLRIVDQQSGPLAERLWRAIAVGSLNADVLLRGEDFDAWCDADDAAERVQTMLSYELGYLSLPRVEWIDDQRGLQRALELAVLALLVSEDEKAMDRAHANLVQLAAELQSVPLAEARKTLLKSLYEELGRAWRDFPARRPLLASVFFDIRPAADAQWAAARQEFGIENVPAGSAPPD